MKVLGREDIDVVVCDIRLPDGNGKTRLQQRVRSLQQLVKHAFSFDNIIGKSPAIRETIAFARKVTGTDTTVLRLGETGTGKELFAKAIHAGSDRAAHIRI